MSPILILLLYETLRFIICEENYTQNLTLQNRHRMKSCSSSQAKDMM
jgi:hypothetical protein